MIVTPSFFLCFSFPLHSSIPPNLIPDKFVIESVANYPLKSSVGLEKGDKFFVTHVTDQYVSFTCILTVPKTPTNNTEQRVTK
jgi:hypothetical protein